MKTIDVNLSVYNNNEKIAKEVNEFARNNGFKIINLLGTPGSGKTTILECIIKNIHNKDDIAIIEGDLFTNKDAKRIEDLGVKVIQLNTKGSCHLEAYMIKDAIKNMNIKNIKYLIIDNIGNLVCTSEFNLGEDLRVGVISVTEGNDKPMKYPLMFQTSNIVILNKIDIVQFTNFSIHDFYEDVKLINNNVKIIKTCARKNEGIELLMKEIF